MKTLTYNSNKGEYVDTTDNITVVFNLDNIQYKLTKTKLVIISGKYVMEILNSDVTEGSSISEYYSNLLAAIAANKLNSTGSSEIESQVITRSFSSNGSYTISPDAGKVISSAIININVPQTIDPTNTVAGRAVYRYKPSTQVLTKQAVTYNNSTNMFTCSVPTNVGDWVYITTDEEDPDIQNYSNVFCATCISSATGGFSLHNYCLFTDDVNIAILDYDY